MSNSDRVRVLFPDHLNIARGKYVPMSMAAGGHVRFCQGVYALTHDRDLIPAPGGGLLTGLPDMAAVFDPEDIQDGWQGNTKIAIADLEFEDQRFGLCGRSLLKQAVQAWRDEGLETHVGIELEANLFEKNEEGEWVPYDDPGSYVYGTGPAADPLGFLDEVWDRANEAGFQVESLNSEFDAGQFEMTLHYKDALAAVDEIFLFRLMAREVAAEMGLLLNFMPKPHETMGGSGFHINFSFTDSNGNNVLNDQTNDDGLSSIAHHSIAGLIKHHRALAAILAPLTNSYKRLQPASMSGYWANWGYDHRGVTVRVPAERNKATRIEHRMADCGANPYTATAAVLLAAKLGWDNKYTLQPAETGDCFEETDASVHVAADLAGAVKDLQEDTAMVEKLGQLLVDHHVAIKEAEFEKVGNKEIADEFAYYGAYV